MASSSSWPCPNFSITAWKPSFLENSDLYLTVATDGLLLVVWYLYSKFGLTLATAVGTNNQPHSTVVFSFFLQLNLCTYVDVLFSWPGGDVMCFCGWQCYSLDSLHKRPLPFYQHKFPYFPLSPQRIARVVCATYFYPGGSNVARSPHKPTASRNPFLLPRRLFPKM